MTVCWHQSYQLCRLKHADGYFSYERCRSGRRWFWAVHRYNWDTNTSVEFHSLEDSEPAATQAARATVEKLADGKDCSAHFFAGTASDILKELNAAKRAARPASGATDSKVVEYLYGHTSGGETSNGSPVRFRIVKKTAKRIYYIAKEECIDKHGNVKDYGNIVDTTPETIGYVDRQKLEADGEVYNNGRHWCSPDFHLHATLAGLHRMQYDERKPPNLAHLKAAMAAAHPDRGGSNEAFIEARKQYVAARRATREHAS